MATLVDPDGNVLGTCSANGRIPVGVPWTLACRNGESVEQISSDNPNSIVAYGGAILTVTVEAQASGRLIVRGGIENVAKLEGFTPHDP